jgi:hypothetical protein
MNYLDTMSSQSEDESQSASQDEETWGGADNEVILPQSPFFAALLGIAPVYYTAEFYPPPPLSIQESSSSKRPRDDDPPRVPKAFKNEDGEKVLHRHAYLKLKSGEELFFEDNDGKILLNEIVEPDRLVRNIISKVPTKIHARLEYLAKFKDESELINAIYSTYIKEHRLRFIFKKFLLQWRIYKMNKACHKELDPITLSEPEKEVDIYDWTVKKKFIFDAKSLATLIETKLMYQEYGFPLPMYPKNPSNNVEFSYKQLLTIYNQLKDHGELRWCLTTLREYNFNKTRWHMYHKSALIMNAIKTSILLLDTQDGRDLLTDFIFAKMEELGFKSNNYIFNAYQVAMVRDPNNWYLEKLKSQAIAHYEAEHFSHNKRRAINAVCLKIFKNHDAFIKDLQNKKII